MSFQMLAAGSPGAQAFQMFTDGSDQQHSEDEVESIQMSADGSEAVLADDLEDVEWQVLADDLEPLSGSETEEVILLPETATGVPDIQKELLADFLQTHGLTEYLPGLQQLGYDQLRTLKDMQDDQIKEMCDDVKMKKGHRIRFVQALTEPDTTLLCEPCNDRPFCSSATSHGGSELCDNMSCGKLESAVSLTFAQKLDKLLGQEEECINGLRIHYLPLVDVYSDRVNKTSICEVNLPCQLHVGPPVADKVILIIGATGAGKSTLINGIVNYLMGVQWEDTFRLKMVQEKATTTMLSQAHSQTDWITAYKIHAAAGMDVKYNVTIIDTPGFGDTRGIERDANIVKQLKGFFEFDPVVGHGIMRIDGICFVAQSSLARLTPSQRYVFDSMLSMFGKDVADIIHMCFTFADGQKPQAIAGVDAAEIPYKSWFKFNNSALYVSQEGEDGSKNDFDHMFWDMGVQSFHKFFGSLDIAQPRSLMLTRSVLEERERLEAAVVGFQPQIQACLHKAEELKKEARICQQMQAEMDANRDFKYQIQVPKIKQEDLPIGTYTTNCLTCNMTCHCPCMLGDNDQKRSCAAMDRQTGNCNVCPGRCHWSQHKNMRFKFETYVVHEVRTSEDLKQRYNTASSGQISAKEILEKLKSEIVGYQKIAFGQIEQMRRSCNRLAEIALRPNHMSSLDYIDMLIQAEEHEARPGFHERKAGLLMMRRRAETLHEAMKDSYDPLANYWTDPDVQFAMRTIETDKSSCVVS